MSCDCCVTEVGQPSWSRPPQREEHSPRKEGAYQDDSSSKSELGWQLGLEDFWLPKAGVFLLCYSAFPLLLKRTFHWEADGIRFEHWNNVRLSCFTRLCQIWHRDFSRGLTLKWALVHFLSKCYSHSFTPSSIISKSFLIRLAYMPHFSSNWNISLSAHLRRAFSLKSEDIGLHPEARDLMTPIWAHFYYWP